MKDPHDNFNLLEISYERLQNHINKKSINKENKMQNNNSKVQQYRRQGYKVQVHHYRYTPEGELISYSRKSKGPIATHGGHTNVTLETPDGKQITSHSTCSKKDNFNYALGVKIALGRIENELKEATA